MAGPRRLWTVRPPSRAPGTPWLFPGARGVSGLPAAAGGARFLGAGSSTFLVCDPLLVSPQSVCSGLGGDGLAEGDRRCWRPGPASTAGALCWTAWASGDGPRRPGARHAALRASGSTARGARGALRLGACPRRCSRPRGRSPRRPVGRLCGSRAGPGRQTRTATSRRCSLRASGGAVDVAHLRLCSAPPPRRSHPLHHRPAVSPGPAARSAPGTCSVAGPRSASTRPTWQQSGTRATTPLRTSSGPGRSARSGGAVRSGTSTRREYPTAAVVPAARSARGLAVMHRPGVWPRRPSCSRRWTPTPHRPMWRNC
jgi:hypothetical protein